MGADQGQEERPAGRDEVRRAVLRSARKHFAEKGTGASLREIAADAGVNLGLIHRHFGKKDDLLREVLAQGQRHAVTNLSGVHTAPEAIRRMFLGSVADTELVRTLAWLSLQGTAAPWSASTQRTIAVVRQMGESSKQRDLRLLAALTILYGWSLFSAEMLSAFDIPSDERAAVEADLADLLMEIVEG